MYFYLLNNSSLIKEKNEMKIVKLFMYGVVSYLLTHLIFFTGGNKIFNSIKTYFWIILIVDVLVVYTIFSKINENSLDILDIFGFKKNNSNSNFLNKESQSSKRIPDIIYQPPENKKKKNNKTENKNKLEKLENTVLEKINEKINLNDKELNNLSTDVINNILNMEFNSEKSTELSSKSNTKKEETNIDSDSDIDIEAFKKML